MLDWALDRNGPTLIRYPKARTMAAPDCPPLETGRGIYHHQGANLTEPSPDVCIAFTGGLLEEAEGAARILEERGIPCALYNLRFIKPLDETFFQAQINRFNVFAIAEEGTVHGSFAEYAAAFALQHGSQTKIVPLTAADTFFPHASRAELLETAGLSAQRIAETVAPFCNLRITT
jgi:1-deoxy-D-xylulose-5-phosphate synthase